ncbi:hypothetical protein D5086_031745 [Populus alba]|uniref:Uncharacterized protein n=1 Tax=Populus alba TaxID=43335 RepID=A0ACC4AJI6_POPAL
MAAQISKKRKFVADGVFYAELNEVLTRELAEDGYSGVEVRVTPMRTEIIIRATRTQNVLGEEDQGTDSVFRKRFKFPENGVELYAEKVNNRGLCAIAQASLFVTSFLEALLFADLVMESGAKGCEVIVSGKLRAQTCQIHEILRMGQGGPMTPLPIGYIHPPKEDESSVAPPSNDSQY